MILSTNFVPRGFDAVTAWPVIFIRPARRHDAALIEHEMTHYRRQAWLTPVWWLRYALSKSFRWNEEVAAYRAQMREGGITIAQAADMLLTYNTGRDRAAALLALTP